jgi:hypothetical protein
MKPIVDWFVDMIVETKTGEACDTATAEAALTTLTARKPHLSA